MQGRSGMLLFIAAFGVLLPLMNGRAWITSPVLALAWTWVPMFLVSTVIADAFAGERERHTLETLLASRLSESAILLGKMGAAIGYSAFLCVVSMITGVVVVNAVFREGGLVFFQWQLVAAMFTVGILGAVFTAALGSILSLRAATVKQAQQTLGAMIFILFLVPIWIVRALPDWLGYNPFGSALLAGQTAVAGVALFIVIDAALIALALSRFRRGRIIAG
jgi:ABC-2 type transport system permease protein